MRGRADTVKTLGLALPVALLAAVLLAVSEGWPMAHRIALLAAGPGVLFLVIAPNIRLTLAGVWIFLHPLSLERVFPVGQPFWPGFLPPLLVISASDVALVLLLAVLLLERLSPGNRQPNPPAALIPLLLLAVWGMFLTFSGINGAAGTLATLQGFKMVLFVAALSLSIRNKQEFQFILVCMGVAVALQVVFIQASVFSSSSFSFSTKADGELLPFTGSEGESVARATGTVGHTNEEAAFLTFFAFPLAALLWVRNFAWRWAAALVLGAASVCLVQTYSRSAWLSVGLGLAVMAWVAIRRHRMSRFLFVLSVPVLCFFLLVGLFYGQKVYERLVYGDEGATSFRKRAIGLAMNMASIEPVIGVGPGGYARAALTAFPPDQRLTRWIGSSPVQIDPVLDYGRMEVTPITGKDDKVYLLPLLVHNKLLLVLVEQGAVGLALFLAFLLMVLRQVLRELKSGDPWTARAAMALAGAFFASLSYMQLDLFVNDKSLQLLLTVPALILALGRTDRTTKGPGA